MRFVCCERLVLRGVFEGCFFRVTSEVKGTFFRVTRLLF